MAVDHCKWLKPHAVVTHSHHESLAFNPYVNFDLRAIRMADDVVNTLLKDEKHLAPDIRSDRQVVLARRGAELKMNAGSSKHIAGKLAHPLLQIRELVLGWI